MVQLLKSRWPGAAILWAWNLTGFLCMLAGQFLPESLPVVLMALLGVILFRSALWVSPLLLTLLAWIPGKKRQSPGSHLLLFLLLLLVQNLFFLGWYSLTGTWY